MSDEKYDELMAIGDCAYAAIAEMVRACDIETAAEDFAATLDRDTCVELLENEAGIECHEDESVDTLREAVAVNIADGTIEPSGFHFDEDDARQVILDDPLSLLVRSGWYEPGGDSTPEEFELLLTTGGPAVRIIGELNEHSEPCRPRLEVQDWGTRWTEYNRYDQDILLTYCRNFVFGE